MFLSSLFQSEWLLNGLDDLRHFTKMWVDGSDDLTEFDEKLNLDLLQVCKTHKLWKLNLSENSFNSTDRYILVHVWKYIYMYISVAFQNFFTLFLTVERSL